MVADPNLISYLKEQADAGFGKDQIYQALLNAGWTREQINEAIREMVGGGSGREVSGGKPADEQPGSQLLKYIKEQLDRGFRKAQIYDALLKAGWYKEEVDGAFYEIADLVYGRPGTQGMQEARQEIPGGIGFFWRMRSVLLRPGMFFEAVRKERGMEALKFYGVLSCAHLAIALGAFLAFLALPSGFMGSAPFGLIVQALPAFTSFQSVDLFLGYFAVLAVPLLAALLIHLFAYILGGRNGFNSTFRAAAYSATPALLIWPVFLLSFFLPVAGTAALLIYSIGLGAWILYLLARGLRKFHGISAARALLSALLPAIIALAAASFLFMPALMKVGDFSFLGGVQGNPEQIRLNEYAYSYDGRFSLSFRNMLGEPMTVSSVALGCGAGGSQVSLETSGYTHLEPGDSIAYSTAESGCLPREPGERYKVSLVVRYLDGSGYARTYQKEVDDSVSSY